MAVKEGSRRRLDSLRRLPGRAPLRVKLVAALLALVAIALAVISVSSLAVFRSYLQDRADAQLKSLIAQAHNTSRVGGPHGPAFTLSGYVVELRDGGGHLVRNFGSWQDLNVPGPSVPTGSGWLSANAGKIVTVPAVSGNDSWRVIAERATYQEISTFTLQPGPQRHGTVIVGVDLGKLDQTTGWLGRLDLLVSLVIMAALAIAGVAAVRASLRPLTDIERTAQGIAAGDLSRRVPEHDPRTEVGRLGRALNVMLSQIEAAFHARAKSEEAARSSEERMRRFIADASHELRTPLTAIRGYAEYYRQRGGAASAAEPPPGPGSGTPAATGTASLTAADLDRIMDRVEHESARMGVLVEDLLLLARLDQQRPLDLRPVDLLTVAADSVADARMIAPDRAIDLSVGSGTAFLVLGDEARLRQVISNLMSNSLTHTPDGTPVHVRLSSGMARPAGAALRPAAILEVADEGPGMPPEQAERVFERFYRADQSRTRKRGGTGLGLAIVAALVAAHRGTVSVQTAPGRGATFRITLPLAPEARLDPEEPGPLTTGAGRPGPASTS